MATQADSLTTIQKPEWVRNRLRDIGFWFVDIPRTSSTTLKLAFYRRYGKVFGKPADGPGIGMGPVPHHLPARLTREQVGPELWDSLYTFSIVRNPFERSVSVFHFLQKHGKLQGWTFPRYVDQVIRPGGFDYHGHYLSNCGYVCDTDGRLLVSEVFRFEQRDEAMASIAAKTACPELVENRSRNYESGSNHYSQYYNPVTRRKIESYYRDDLERFGYTFESG